MYIQVLYIYNSFKPSHFSLNMRTHFFHDGVKELITVPDGWGKFTSWGPVVRKVVRYTLTRPVND